MGKRTGGGIRRGRVAAVGLGAEAVDGRATSRGSRGRRDRLCSSTRLLRVAVVVN